MFAGLESQLNELYITQSICAIVQGAPASHICWVGIPVDLTIILLRVSLQWFRERLSAIFAGLQSQLTNYILLRVSRECPPPMFAGLESQFTQMYGTLYKSRSFLAVLSQGAPVSHVCWVENPVDLTAYQFESQLQSSRSDNSFQENPKLNPK